MSYTFLPKGNGGLFYVPNSVVDRHMRSATHMQLKALLYYLRRIDGFDVEEMCTHLNATISEMEGAVNFWIAAGVLKNGEDGIRFAQECIEQDGPRNAPPAAITAPPAYEFEEISKAMDGNPRLKSLFQSVQRILNKEMGNAQTKSLFSLIDHYGFPPETIFAMAKYCADSGNGTFKALMQTAQEWYRMGLVSEEAVLTYIEQMKKRRSDEFVLRKLFGIGERGLSTTEKKLFRQWLEEYNFSEEMLRLAYDRCIDSKQKYLPKYIDAILRSWFEKGYRTPQEAAEEPLPEKQTQSGRRKKAEAEATFDAEEFVNWSFQMMYGEKDKEEGGKQ